MRRHRISPPTKANRKEATRGRRHPASSNRKPPRATQPLHEALAIGLGCETLGHKWIDPPEWA